MFYLILLLLQLSCLAQQTALISYITQNQIKYIGENVELECSVRNVEENPVMWIKILDLQSTIFISTGDSVVINDTRFAIRYDEASTTYTLQIKDFQETDAGTYQCQVYLSTSKKISADVELTVRRPALITNQTISLVVSEGNPAQMECYINGNPQPTVSWRRENNANLPKGIISSQIV